MMAAWHVDRRGTPDPRWFPVEALSEGERGPFVQRIAAGNLGAAVIPGALPPEACAAWAARLDGGEHPVAPTRFAREFEAWSFGPCLDQSEGDVNGYLARVEPFERALRGAAPGCDVIDRVLAALGRLAAALPIERPAAPDGRPYGLLTLRGLPPGGLIPPHCENEQLPRRAYDALRPRLDTSVLMSFYVTVRPADQGGELSVHDLGVDAIGARVRHGHSVLSGEVDRSPAVRLWFEPGTLVIFDGGRRFHQVLPVRGARQRWTLGGFAALSSDRSRLFVWA